MVKARTYKERGTRCNFCITERLTTIRVTENQLDISDETYTQAIFHTPTFQ